MAAASDRMLGLLRQAATEAGEPLPTDCCGLPVRLSRRWRQEAELRTAVDELPPKDSTRAVFVVFPFRPNDVLCPFSHLRSDTQGSLFHLLVCFRVFLHGNERSRRSCCLIIITPRRGSCTPIIASHRRESPIARRTRARVCRGDRIPLRLWR